MTIEFPGTISDELLHHAPPRVTLEASVRPSQSYWQQVGRRLLRSPRALLALLVIAVLIFGAVVGPVLWPIDPAGQSIGATSRGPSFSSRALLVFDLQPWQIIDATPLGRPRVAARLGAPAQLEIIESNTQRVRLRWQRVPGAVSYRIYRHSHPPRDRTDLGLPIGETFLPGQVSFEDGLALREQNYWYSVVAASDFNQGAEESPHYSTIQTKPVSAIGWLEAQLQGLIPIDADPADWAGKNVELPGHPIGTDYLGRDLLARVIHGARTSLFIGITAPLLFVALGVLYGAVAGFVGGRIDVVLMRFADFVVALPMLLFMILLRLAFGIGPGESGVLPMVIALVVMGWPASARLVRGQVLQLREEGFVAAARLAGGGNLYIIARHMLPNVLGVVLVALTFAIPSAIFTEAFLSFIGMGVTPPTPSWGSMSNDGLRNMFEHPAELFWPALCISLTVLAFNMLGDALRDALDVAGDSSR